MSKFEAVIFDMDGTLLDSEVFAFGIWAKALKEFGFNLEKDTFSRMVGSSVEETNRLLKECFGENLLIPELRKRKLGIEIEALVASKIDCRQGVLETLEYLKKNNFPFGLATTTERERAILRLENAGIRHYFSVIVCGDEVRNQKPDPEIYVTVASKLGVGIRDCLIVEDSPAGVRGGLSAGGTVFWFKDLADISEDLKSQVVIIDNMSSILKSLF